MECCKTGYATGCFRSYKQQCTDQSDQCRSSRQNRYCPAERSQTEPCVICIIAPYENPEVTVTSVIPFGYSSGNAVELSGLVYAYLYDPDVLENTTITGNNALSD